jgi:hypothetical protein
MPVRVFFCVILHVSVFLPKQSKFPAWSKPLATTGFGERYNIIHVWSHAVVVHREFGIWFFHDPFDPGGNERVDRII